MALAEKAFAGGFGIDADLDLAVQSGQLSDQALLFSESQSRLAVTVSPENRQSFEALFAACDCAYLGEVTQTPVLRLRRGTRILIDTTNQQNKAAWQTPLREL